MNKSEQERFWDGGAAPKPPRFIALRQDSWPERRAALALSESRPLSRRSGCVSAEPCPPLRSVQSIRDTMERKTLAVYTKHLTRLFPDLRNRRVHPPA
jgi:hypothetical protein